uniref:Uncharacterized protein n=1 Tax=Glossina morsitans morsitans TaxID=37546 RepID=A0A1B0G1Y3_GLOMM
MFTNKPEENIINPTVVSGYNKNMGGVGGDDQTELKAGVDAVQCSSKKLDKALLALKVRRTVTEQQIDRVNDFAKRIQEDSSGVSLDELNIRLKALHSAFDAFNKVQTKIEEKDFDEISQPNRSKYKELYYCIATTLKVCMSKLDNSDSNQTVHASHAILPAWFDEFTSLVQNNERLNTFTKLHHLASKLSPAARAPIAGIKIIAGNYEIILQRLKDRFENKKIIGNQHIKQIFEQPKIIYANAADLRELIDTMNNHLIGRANHNMSDQAQPKNFAAVKTQHTERNILATAIVYIILKYNQRFPCRVLLDGGSQVNMISERMVHMTSLKRQYAPIQFQCANKTVGTSNFKCITNFESLLKPFSVTLEAHIGDQISGTLPNAEIDISDWNIPEHIPLADECFNIPQRVDMLLGVDIFFDVLENGKIALGRNRPILTNTRLGWIVAGTLPHHANSIAYVKCNSLQISNVQQNDHLSDAIKAFWEIESFKECSPKLSQEEER